VCEESLVEESSKSGLDSDVDEWEESPIMELSDEEECKSSESEVGSCRWLAGPNHLVKGCCCGPLAWGFNGGCKGLGRSGGPYT
jgi:hypothetical protein